MQMGRRAWRWIVVGAVGAVPTTAVVFGGVASAAATNGQIAFVTNKDGNDEIYVIAPDGSGATNLTNSAANEIDPSWSPDGSRIAFVSDRTGNNNIYVMAADGSGPRRITTTSGVRSDRYPAWSPDATKIAYRSNRSGTSFDIHVMNADGSGDRIVASDPAFDSEPAWSPDGTQIVFMSERSGSRQIWSVSPAGGAARELTSVGTNRFPSWSPDSSTISFSSDRDGNEEIYAMRRDGTGQTRVTTSPQSDRYPVWAPDGTAIAFRVALRSQRAIYRMAPDGSGLVRLTADIARDIQPSWQAIQPGNGIGGRADAGPPPEPVVTPPAPALGTGGQGSLTGSPLSITRLRAVPKRFHARTPSACFDKLQLAVPVTRRHCTHSRSRLGTSLRFVASRRARVRFTIRGVGARHAAGYFAVWVHPGHNRVRFVGALRTGHPLRRGRYVVRLRDAAIPTGPVLAKVRIRVLPAR